MSIYDDVQALDTIALTHVFYNPSDHVSHFFAYITLAPIAILVFYASVIVSRRELAGIFILLGQLSNEAFNFLLKQLIEQERPHSHLGTGYGMPSSHSQFIWFFAVYGTLYMYKYIHLDHSIWKILTSSLMFILAILVAMSRIYLGYHTASQVVIGSSIGIAYGWLWYKLVDYVHSTKWIIDRILNSEISKKLYLKDMYFIQNVAKWEYEQWLTAYKKTL